MPWYSGNGSGGGAVTPPVALSSSSDLSLEVGADGIFQTGIRDDALVSFHRAMVRDDPHEDVLHIGATITDYGETMGSDKSCIIAQIANGASSSSPNGVNALAGIFQGYIGSSATSGRAYGALHEARTVSAADDGLLIATESGLFSHAAAIVTDPDNQKAKINHWISNHTTLGGTKATGGIVFSNDASGWHHGLYMRHATQAFITMAGSTNPVNAIDMSAITPSGDAILMGTGAVLRWGASGTRLSVGSGTPEAAVTAPVGSLFARTDGGLYQKQTGTGTTGWGPPLRSYRQGHLVSTVFPFWNVGTPTVVTANQAYGVRVEIPASGTLQDILIFVGTASGNVDVGVYSISGTDRTRLWSSGSVAAAGANAWQNIGDPGITVTAGQWVDFVVAVDNGTVTLGRNTAAFNACGTLPSGVDDLAPAHIWGKGTSFPLPASITAIGTANIVPVIVARVAP